MILTCVSHACKQATACNWRGKADGVKLQRVYGVSFPDKEELEVILAVCPCSRSRQNCATASVLCTMVSVFTILVLARCDTHVVVERLN